MARRHRAAACLLALALLVPGCGKKAYLPEAENDFVVGTVGLGEPREDGPGPPPESIPSPEAPAGTPVSSAESEPAGSLPDGAGTEVPLSPPGDAKRSVGARPTEPSYPVGTAEIVLSVENRTGNDLRYTNWFDIRRVEGDRLLPLAPRPGLTTSPDDVSAEQVLPGGGKTEITLPIDLFDEPLPPGTYRAAQLACFSDPGGQALACSEITADFVIAES